MNTDVMHRFSFREASIRGQWVRLESVLGELAERRSYPRGVADMLAQMLAAVAMVAEGIQFRGTVALQSRSSGPLTTVLAECRDRHLLRGIAHWPDNRPEPEATSIAALLGAGRLTITLQQPASTDSAQPVPYQGLIALTEDDLAGNLERYFANSEQLPTRLFFAMGVQSVTGLLLQRLPAREDRSAFELDVEEQSWLEIGALADHLDPVELARLEPASLLARTFRQHTLTLHPAQPLQFSCTCSEERISNVLKAMGRTELLALLQEADPVSVTCEVCGRVYAFDSVDVHFLLDPGAPKVH